MKSNELNRVVFFSVEDMSGGHNLMKAENLLDNIDLNKEFEINDLLEIYNIKLYFDNNLFLNNWSEKDKTKYKNIIATLWNKVRDFWINIDNNNIVSLIDDIEFRYKNYFWDLINYFKSYKNIDKVIFTSILDKSPNNINYILVNKLVVNHFNNEIREFLINYKNSAALLLAKIEVQKTNKKDEYCFPKSLTLKDRELIISKYLDNDDANLNYVNLILKSKKSNELDLSSKIKLKAKNKVKVLNNEILEKGVSWNVRVQVGISKDQIEPAKFSNENNTLDVSYSEKYLNNQKSDIELFHNFTLLFLYTDDKGLITLISRQNELGTFEKIMMKSKNEYLIGEVFNKKSFLSQIQIVILNHYLINQRNKSIEELTSSFIDRYLNENFNINFEFKFPSEYSSFFEKIRILAPEFEFLLKQYQSFVDEESINFELIGFNSEPLRFSEIRSLVSRKYVYIKDNLILQLKYYFFSDQSMLYYVEKFKDKYHNFYNLIKNENVKIEDFENYQKDIIQKLIDDKYLFLDKENNVKIEKEIMLYLIGELFKDEVLSYWHYEKEIRYVIDDMIEKDYLNFESTLFTKQEIKYLNFHLNTKEFTNGLDLRNKYLHGTNSSSENENKNDYYVLLKIIILSLLKIEDDLILDEISNE